MLHTVILQEKITFRNCLLHTKGSESEKLITFFSQFIHFLQNHSLVYPESLISENKDICEKHLKIKPHEYITSVLCVCVCVCVFG